MDYFKLFDTKVSLLVDRDAILKKYYALSRQFHPDRFTLAGEAAQAEALQMSALINAAKKVLDDPELRLAYWLKEQKVISDEEKYTLPPVFLGEMMELNEAVMEAGPDSMSVVRQQVIAQMDALRKNVDGYFEAAELELQAADLQILKDYYYKRKYLQRILDRIS